MRPATSTNDYDRESNSPMVVLAEQAIAPQKGGTWRHSQRVVSYEAERRLKSRKIQ